MFLDHRSHPHAVPTRTRREFVRDAFCGFGGLALASLLENEQVRADVNGPLAPKPPHIPAKAKAVIFLFMAGGPSHLETFDPKPLLDKLEGQTRPKEFGDAKYQFVERDAKLLGTRRRFKKYGQSGIEVSDLFPHTAQCVDDLAVIRSCHGDMVVHSAAQYELFTGRIVPGFPSIGSWVLYGLGSESRSLPSYVVMPDPKGRSRRASRCICTAFCRQFTSRRCSGLAAGRCSTWTCLTASILDRRRRTLDLIHDLNQATLDPADHEFAARMNAYDLAFKMQTEAPQVLDISREPRETLELYGIGIGPTDDYGRRCLLARKLVEQGVRFVCVVSGGGPGNCQWDAHNDIDENHTCRAAETDKPVAGLLKDLKRRGLLDETLVLWGGEFGRSPEAESGRGRDHHNLGFTMWMAGGGIRGGQVVGATDAIGLRAIERPYHFRDIHTTILHQLGLDQHRLTYPHLGRDERLTFVEGSLIREVV